MTGDGFDETTAESHESEMRILYRQFGTEWGKGINERELFYDLSKNLWTTKIIALSLSIKELSLLRQKRQERLIPISN